MSNRHLSRTIALQSLYLWDFNGQKKDINDIVKENLKRFAPNFKDYGFIEYLVNGVLKNIKQIDRFIIKYASEWPLEQIAIIDRNVIRLGIFEIVFNKDMPNKVAINEAIEIAKTFGSATSGKFVNGVLGAILRDVNNGKIK